MSACHCCQYSVAFQPGVERSREPARRPALFNRVTALLLTGWVGIVAAAMQMAGAEQVRNLPTIELFIRSLIGG